MLKPLNDISGDRSRREQLKFLVRGMFGLLLLAFVFVSLRSLNGVESDNSLHQALSIDQLPLGKTTLRRVDGMRLWITRLSDQQRRDAALNKPFLMDSQTACPPQLDVCALSATAAKYSVDIVFSLKAPPQLPDEANWLGGFIDPTTGAVFDLLGRAYRLGRDSDGQRMRVYNFN
jgi:hypothetical protein